MARDFNGSSDAIDFGNAAVLNGQLGMTVAAWVYADSVASGSKTILCRGRGGVSGTNFSIQNGSELKLSKHSVVDITTSSINVPATTWVLLAAVVSSTQVRFHKYVPGSGLTSENVADTNSFNNTGVTESRVGAVLDSGGSETDYMDGKIAEIARWNRELTDAEITGLGLGYCPLFFPSSLEFYVPMIGNNSPETDFSGGLTGTISGTSKYDHPRIIHPH